MNYRELGFLILRYRRDTGLTQQEFADKVKLSRNYVCQIERGKARHLSLEVLTKVAVGIGVAVKELVG